MGKVTGLRCPKCMQRYAVEIEGRLCERCHYILEVEVDLSELRTKRPDYFLNRAERSIWRWREFLPIEK
ncbi:MAG: threonine synthase, partial [Candidatus Methylomirabilales bacterium]